jgi:hypothetical protein
MLERFHFRKHNKLFFFLSLFLLVDVIVSCWVILGWRPPFYGDFSKSRSIKKGTQRVVFGTVTEVIGTSVTLVDDFNKSNTYIFPKDATYYKANYKNDKSFTQGITIIPFTVPTKGDWVGVNLFDENNQNNFQIKAIFILSNKLL